MNERNEAIGNALADRVNVEVPDTFLTQQAREKYALMMTDMRDSGMADAEIKKLITPENFLKYKDVAKKSIEKDFKISRAVDEILKVENIEVPSYEVEEQIQSLREQAQKEGDEFDEATVRGKVEAALERRAVFDLLAEHANLTPEYVDQEQFDAELMDELASDSVQREKALADEETA